MVNRWSVTRYIAILCFAMAATATETRAEAQYLFE